MHSFDLTNQPWIPVALPGESKTSEVSIREVLVRAPDIIEITGASPLETAAIHRFLLALLHRVFVIDSVQAWSRLWETGSFDMERIDEYLSEYQNRFDLLDREYPFYQTPGLPEASATTVLKLGHQFSAGNNPLLFDHSQDGNPPALSLGTAARLLLAHHAFAVGGLIGRLPGDPPSAEASHLVKAAVLLHTGGNLFQTLMLNMMAVDGRSGRPFEFDPKFDIPAWERDQPSATERWPAGYLDLLTWQSRRILLFPNDDGTVSKVAIMAGFRFPKSVETRQYETMAAYTKRENATKNQDPWAPIGFRPGRALWRDSVALMQATADRRQPASTTLWLRVLEQSGALPRDLTPGLVALGLSSDRAKVFLWRQEEFPWPLAYLEDSDLLLALGAAVQVAEDVRSCLRRAIWRLSESVLAPGPELSADRERVDALVRSLQVEQAYWPQLDLHFRRHIVALPEQYPDEGPANEAWARALRQAAESAFEGAARAIETSGRGYRAAAGARALFEGQLAAALNPLRPSTKKEAV